MQAISQAKHKILDEAVHVLTGGATSEVITLGCTIPDTSKVYCRPMSAAGVKIGASYGIVYQISSNTEITIHNPHAGVNLTAANKFAYQIIEVPYGHVERGFDTLSVTTSWTEFDIDLVAGVDLNRCQPILNHRGNYYYLNAGGTVGVFGGYTYRHPTDSLKFKVGLISTGGSVSAPIYWEIWSP